MRTLLFLTLALLPGCNNTSPDAGTPSDLSTPAPDLAPSCTIPGGPACSACLAASCAAEAQTCFGPSWQTTTSPGSPCAGFYDCVCNCNQTPRDSGSYCYGSCEGSSSMACQACITVLSQCVVAHCMAQCIPSQ